MTNESERSAFEQIRDHHLRMVAYYTDEKYPRAVQRHQAMADTISRHLAEQEKVEGAPKTIYDHRLAVDNACRDAAPRLYAALKNLLDAVDERRDQMGIESLTISEARNALLSASPSTDRAAAARGGVSDDVSEDVMDAVRAALGDAYDCSRVWSAWSYGTMTAYDFSMVTESDERVEEIARAAIEAHEAGRVAAEIPTRISEAPFYWERGGGTKTDAATAYVCGFNDCVEIVVAKATP